MLYEDKFDFETRINGIGAHIIARVPIQDAVGDVDLLVVANNALQRWFRDRPIVSFQMRNNGLSVRAVNRPTPPQIGDLIIHRQSKEYDTVGDEPRKYIDGAEVSRTLFDDCRSHVFNFLRIVVNGIAAHAQMVNSILSKLVVVIHTLSF